MKIIGINASPKGNASNTLQLVKSVLEGAESEGAETELVDLYKLHIEYCTACGTCYAKGECPLIDDFEELFEKIMNADGIVLGAPNYINSVPAPMKALFDRLSDAIHCQMLTGKFGCSVCTAGGSGEDEVLKYMNGVLMNLGVTVVGGIGVVVGRDPSALQRLQDLLRILGRSWQSQSAEKSNIPIRMKHISSAENIFASWQNSIKSALPMIITGMYRRD